jgi:hypothetical protein
VTSLLISTVLAASGGSLNHLLEGWGDDNDVAMLPYVSFSCWAVMELLSRWAVKKPRAGGFKETDNRASALDLLRAIIIAICENCGGFNMHIALAETWHVTWPRPSPDLPGIKLSVDSRGDVNWRAFADAYFEAAYPWCTWARSREFNAFVCGFRGTVSLLDLFNESQNLKLSGAFHDQLLWDVGLRFQAMLKGGLKKTLNNVTFKRLTVADALDDYDAMNLQLVRYVMTTRNLAAGQIFFSLATDKSAVGGLGSGVQNMVFGLRPNLAIVGIPQVWAPALSSYRLQGTC